MLYCGDLCRSWKKEEWNVKNGKAWDVGLGECGKGVEGKVLW